VSWCLARGLIDVRLEHLVWPYEIRPWEGVSFSGTEPMGL
jgi:hypothetical protein